MMRWRRIATWIVGAPLVLGVWIAGMVGGGFATAIVMNWFRDDSQAALEVSEDISWIVPAVLVGFVVATILAGLAFALVLRFADRVAGQPSDR